MTFFLRKPDRDSVQIFVVRVFFCRTRLIKICHVIHDDREWWGEKLPNGEKWFNHGWPRGCYHPLYWLYARRSTKAFCNRLQRFWAMELRRRWYARKRVCCVCFAGLVTHLSNARSACGSARVCRAQRRCSARSCDNDLLSSAHVCRKAFALFVPGKSTVEYWSTVKNLDLLRVWANMYIPAGPEGNLSQKK